MSDLGEAIDRWRSAAVDHTELAVILDAAARVQEMDRKFDLRWKYDREALRLWYEARGEEFDLMKWPPQIDMVMFLLDKRNHEKRKSWWGGAMWGIAVAAVIAFIAWGPV